MPKVHNDRGLNNAGQLGEQSSLSDFECFQVVNTSFDEGLDKIFPGLTESIDLVYIDGSKEKTANLHYFERLIPYLHTGSLVVLDDIHWSREMRETWKIISRWRGFSYTINTGRFGVCIWSGKMAHPKTHTLYNIAGMDLYQAKQFLEGMKTWLSRIRSRFSEATEIPGIAR